MSKNYLQAAVEIAQQAGKILIEEFSRPLDIRYKGDEVDLVTQADKRSEQFIVSRLNEYFPGHAITAEEGTGQDTASEFRWHVDPLDGTTNFAHHYPCFCVSIALAERDTLLAAAIFNPYYNELYTAARGEGAAFNGKKIVVSEVSTLSTSLLCTGFPVAAHAVGSLSELAVILKIRAASAVAHGKAGAEQACREGGDLGDDDFLAVEGGAFASRCRVQLVVVGIEDCSGKQRVALGQRDGNAETRIVMGEIRGAVERIDVPPKFGSGVLASALFGGDGVPRKIFVEAGKKKILPAPFPPRDQGHLLALLSNIQPPPEFLREDLFRFVGQLH